MKDASTHSQHEVRKFGLKRKGKAETAKSGQRILYIRKDESDIDRDNQHYCANDDDGIEQPEEPIKEEESECLDS